MSAAAKATLLATSLGAIGIVIFVHSAQKTEQAVCPLGALRSNLALYLHLFVEITLKDIGLQMVSRLCTPASFAICSNNG